MKKHSIILQIALVTLSLGSCTEKFSTPAPFVPVEMTPNTTIAELKALYTGGATVVENDLIIEGKVASTDQYGNIYRSLYIQDETSGIELKIGKSAMYTTYKEGQTIYVKAEHLVLGGYGGFISLGAPSNEDKYQNNYIDAQLWINMTIFRGKLGQIVTPKVINKLSDITTNTYGTLVTLKNMIYTPTATDTIRTWSLMGETTPGGNAINQPFVFGDGGQKMVVRTSNYARFADTPMPEVGSHSDLTGILTFYGSSNPTIQLLLNSLAGVKPSMP